VAASVLFLILLLLLIFGIYAGVWWIYHDAQANIVAGTPVVLQIGGFRLESPKWWAIGCLIRFTS
jgi:hypothetical protein